jgi:hypothetical protein
MRVRSRGKKVESGVSGWEPAESLLSRWGVTSSCKLSRRKGGHVLKNAKVYNCKNMFMYPVGSETKKNSAGEGQQQFETLNSINIIHPMVFCILVLLRSSLLLQLMSLLQFGTVSLRCQESPLHLTNNIVSRWDSKRRVRTQLLLLSESTLWLKLPRTLNPFTHVDGSAIYLSLCWRKVNSVDEQSASRKSMLTKSREMEGYPQNNYCVCSHQTKCN